MEGAQETLHVMALGASWCAGWCLSQAQAVLTKGWVQAQEVTPHLWEKAGPRGLSGLFLPNHGAAGEDQVLLPHPGTAKGHHIWAGTIWAVLPLVLGWFLSPSREEGLHELCGPLVKKGSHVETLPVGEGSMGSDVVAVDEVKPFGPVSTS